MIYSWALILFAGVSNAPATVPNFSSQAECMKAGQDAIGWAPKGTTFVCVQQSREPEVINVYVRP